MATRVPKRFLAIALAVTVPLAALPSAAADSQTAETERTSTASAGENEPTITTLPSGSKGMIVTPEVRAEANLLAAERGEDPLPDSVEAVEITDEGYHAVDADGNPVAVPFGFWDTSWKVTKCVAFVTAAVLPGTAAFRAIRSLGGITQAAKLLVQAGSWAEFRNIAGGAASEIIGIAGIEDNCF